MSFKKNDYKKSLLYKLILNNIIIHYGSTCDSKLNKVLFREKTNLKKNKHKNIDLQNYLEDKKD